MNISQAAKEAADDCRWHDTTWETAERIQEAIDHETAELRKQLQEKELIIVTLTADPREDHVD